VPASARASRWAVSIVFLLNGLIMANWVVRVPDVKDRVGAGPGALGLALLCIAVGSLIAMPLTGRIIERVGSHRVTLVTALALSASVVLPGLVTDAVALGLVLTVYGAAFGALDVAMNTQAMHVVRMVGRPIMPSFHAAFSIGGLLGALTGGAAAAAGLGVGLHLAMTGLLSALIIVALRPALVDDRLSAPPAAVDAVSDDEVSPTAPAPSRSPWLRPVLWLLGGLAFCAAFGEGAMADWSALFLRDERGMSAGAAAIGYAAFSITMTIGRLGGAQALERLGPVNVLRAGGTIAALGTVLAVALPSGWVGIVGFGLVGLGLSCVFPVALAAAGDAGPGAGGPEIAVATTLGYLGFLLGPPAIGLLAEWVGLAAALLSVAALAALLVLLAGGERRAHAAEARLSVASGGPSRNG
jgi:predicted MFS family arabinose efflux permease